MNAAEKKLSLEKSAAYIVSRHASLKGIIEPFAALAAKRAEVREALGLRGGPAPVTAGNALRGEPLLGPDQPLELAGDFLLSAGMTLPALGKIFPELGGAAAAVASALADDRLTPEDCVDAFLRRGRKELQALADTANVPVEGFAFILTQVIRPCMENLAEKIGSRVNVEGWFKPYCPVCGLAPEIGDLKEIKTDSDYLVSKGGQLWMRCELCSFEWRFPRVKCPECGADHQKNNEFYHSPDDPAQRIYVCQECKTYFPCLNMADSLLTIDPDLARISFLPLEMRLREMGCKPLSEGPVAIG